MKWGGRKRGSRRVLLGLFGRRSFELEILKERRDGGQLPRLLPSDQIVFVHAAWVCLSCRRALLASRVPPEIIQRHYIGNSLTLCLESRSAKLFLGEEREAAVSARGQPECVCP